MRKYNHPLSDEEIQQEAPSAFAGQPHERQSERYAFIPTIEVIQAMRTEGFLPVDASQSVTRMADRRAFTKHMIRFRSANPVNVGDSILETVLINSHDGTSSYRLMMGVFRLVCSNGLIVADSLIESIRVRHTGNITAEVIRQSAAMLERAPIVQQAIADWSRVILTREDQLLLASAAHILRFGERKEDHSNKLAEAINPEQLLDVRRYHDNGDSLWTVFNRIQENTVNGGLRGRTPREFNQTPRRVRTRQVTGIDQSVSVNQKLWELAQELADKVKNRR